MAPDWSVCQTHKFLKPIACLVNHLISLETLAQYQTIYSQLSAKGLKVKAVYLKDGALLSDE